MLVSLHRHKRCNKVWYHQLLPDELKHSRWVQQLFQKLRNMLMDVQAAEPTVPGGDAERLQVSSNKVTSLTSCKRAKRWHKPHVTQTTTG